MVFAYVITMPLVTLLVLRHFKSFVNVIYTSWMGHIRLVFHKLLYQTWAFPFVLSVIQMVVLTLKMVFFFFHINFYIKTHLLTLLIFDILNIFEACLHW